MKKSSRSNSGFTLVEIMVAISIIAILSTIVFASLMQARGKARDTERASNLKQLQVAVEIYGQVNGHYPAIGCGRTSYTGSGTAFGSCTKYIVGIESFMDPLPVEPIDKVHGYLYYTDGKDYKILSHMSVENDKVTYEHPMARCPSSCSEYYCQETANDFPNTYAVYSPGAACW